MKQLKETTTKASTLPTSVMSFIFETTKRNYNLNIVLGNRQRVKVVETTKRNYNIGVKYDYVEEVVEETTKRNYNSVSVEPKSIALSEARNN